MNRILNSVGNFLSQVFAVCVLGYLVHQMAVGASLLHPWVWAAFAVLTTSTAIFAWRFKRPRGAGHRAVAHLAAVPGRWVAVTRRAASSARPGLR